MDARLSRLAAVALVLGPVQFVVLTTLEALWLIHLGQSYSFLANTISYLGDPSLVPYPYYWMLNGSAIVLGGCLLIGLVSLRSVAPPDLPGRLGLVTYALVGVGAIGVGIFNEHLDYPVHIASAALAFIAAGFTLLLLGLAWRKEPRWRRWSAPMGAGFAVTAVALVLFGSETSWGLGHGGWERLIVAPALLWVICLGVALLRAPPVGSRPA